MKIKHPGYYAKFAASWTRLVVFTLALFAPNVSFSHEDPRQPNFIIILADDLGYGDLGYTGSSQIKTPHIDALAQEGVIFTDGYVSSAVCAPSRAGLMTGRNQPSFGFDNNLPQASQALEQFNPEHHGLPVNVKTLADFLGELGYINGLIGKWHLGEEEQFQPQNRGFHEFWGYLNGGHDYFEVDPKSKSGYLRPLVSNFKEVQPLTYLTDDKGDECVDFIRRHKDRPFFLYASFNAPHGPLQATEADLELYGHIEDERRRAYCAMVHRLDVNVGRIVGELEKQDLYDNTLVVFLSDNGGPVSRNRKTGEPAGIRINAPYRGSKGILLEGGIRVPLSITMPGKITGGATFSEPVSALDLTPTFIHLAGGKVTADQKLDGVDLMPYLQGEATMDPNRELMWRFTVSGSIREGEWKLVRLPDRLPMLYNLKADPSELYDLADKHPERVRDMLRRFGDWDVSLPQPEFLERDYKRNQLNQYDSQYKLEQPDL